MSSELPTLPPRPGSGHKGTFGTVCVLGGQALTPRVMIGGPAFAALGALRAGAGLAVLAVPGPIMNASIEIAPSATGLALPVDASGALRPSAVAELLDTHLATCDCLVVGPGFGAGEAQQQIVIRLTGLDHLPLVLDADALNALSALRDFHADFHSPAVITPHPGEYRRLATALNLDTDLADDSQRHSAAETLAQKLGCVVVLKGAGTVVSDGVNTWINPSGGPALATAGTGDVLTGVIAGFVAQFFKRSLGARSVSISAEQQGGLSLYDCARLGVYVHGRAADLWAAGHGDAGMLATDLLELIPATLSELRAGRT